MTAADVITTPDDLDEVEHRPMSDREHAETFGWAWDDPDTVEVSA